MRTPSASPNLSGLYHTATTPSERAVEFSEAVNSLANTLRHDGTTAVPLDLDARRVATVAYRPLIGVRNPDSTKIPGVVINLGDVALGTIGSSLAPSVVPGGCNGALLFQPVGQIYCIEAGLPAFRDETQLQISNQSYKLAATTVAQVILAQRVHAEIQDQLPLIG